MPIVKEIARKTINNVNYKLVDKDKNFIKKIFNSTNCATFVRAGDAELYTLNNRRNLCTKGGIKGKINVDNNYKFKLAQSLHLSDVVGLPSDYINLMHPRNWDVEIMEICKKRYKVPIYKYKIVSASIFNIAPELLGEIISDKTVLWINYEAYKFSDLIKNNDFCSFYGIYNVKSKYINIPDGKAGWNHKMSMIDLVTYVIKEIDNLKLNNFDIAIIGAGSAANLICMYIKDTLKKSAIDVGSFLSAMKGHRCRNHLKIGGKREFLVWRG